MGVLEAEAEAEDGVEAEGVIALPVGVDCDALEIVEPVDRGGVVVN